MTTDNEARAEARRPTRLVLIEDMIEHQVLVAAQINEFEESAELIGIAGSMAEARTLLDAQGDAVDLVICDLGLPDTSGLEVVEILTSEHPRLPVIVLSSRRDEGLNALRAGAQDYLIKGQATALTLERAVRHSLTRHELSTALHATTREIEQLVYAFTHDLRGPLSVATGFVSLLEEAGLNERQSELIAPVQRALARMEGITQEFMHYAKSVQGELDVQPTDLRLLVLSVAHDLALEGQVAVSDSLPVMALDERLMRHVMENLLGNAAKYASPERALQVHVGVESHPMGWQINVDDNGRGLPKVAGDRIFGIFVRGQENDAIPGSGMGLAICRRAIERHQGRIWSQGNPVGHGSRFAFALPDDLELGPEGQMA